MAKRIYPHRYLEAAHHRLRDALLLHDAERYGLALYVAGVAAESVLRAYRTRNDAQFHERHDLRALLEGCNQKHFGEHRRQFMVSIAVMNKIWQNDFRYHSHQLLMTRFRKRKMTHSFEGRTILGDPLKFYSGVAIDHAETVVAIGDEQWTSSTN